MSDDLMKRLQSLHKQATVERSHFYVGSWAEDAIRRIEELEDALSLRTNLHGEATYLIHKLEAKLAKAVEAVDVELIEQAISDVLSEGGTYRDAAEYVARTTIAAQKGETQ